jgi:phage-related protein
MAATTFTWTPSFPAAQNSQPTVRTVKFGDGYEQRLRYGLRTDLKQWDLVFENRTDTERDQILTFLSARGGVEQFNWTTPHGETRAFVCESWNSEHSACNLNNISAKFREVIDL